jgi:hypothetical protein
LFHTGLLNRLLRTKASSGTVQSCRELPTKKLLLPTLPEQIAKRRLSRLLLLQAKHGRLRGRSRLSARLASQKEPLCLCWGKTSSRGQLRRRSRLRRLKRPLVLHLGERRSATLSLRPQRLRKGRLLCAYATRSLKRTKRLALCTSKCGTRLRARNGAHKRTTTLLKLRRRWI